MINKITKRIIIAITSLAFSSLMSFSFYFISDEKSHPIDDAIGGFASGIIMSWVYVKSNKC